MGVLAPRLVGGVGSYPLLSLAPTHVEVELGCDNYFSHLLWKIPHDVEELILSEEILMQFILLSFDIFWVWFGAT